MFVIFCYTYNLLLSTSRLAAMRISLPLHHTSEMLERINRTSTWRLARVSKALRRQRGHEPFNCSEEWEHVKVQADSHAIVRTLDTGVYFLAET